MLYQIKFASQGIMSCVQSATGILLSFCLKAAVLNWVLLGPILWTVQVLRRIYYLPGTFICKSKVECPVHMAFLLVPCFCFKNEDFSIAAKYVQQNGQILKSLSNLLQLAVNLNPTLCCTVLHLAGLYMALTCLRYAQSESLANFCAFCSR